MIIKSFTGEKLLYPMLLLLFLSGCGPKDNQKISKNNKMTTIKDKDINKKKKTYFRDLDYEGHKRIKNKLLAEKRRETAITHIEKMIPLCDDIQEISNLTLELADLYFDIGNLRKAESWYNSFEQLYPGDKNIEYANYKSILCSYWLTLDAERDQSPTKNAIERSKKFLARSDIYHEYTDEVAKILADCQNKLLESEIKVFNFYLKQGDYLSAKTRLANMEKEFLKDMPKAEPQLLMLACDFAEKVNNTTLLKEKKQELQTKFPNYQQDSTIVAHNKKPSFLNKF